MQIAALTAAAAMLLGATAAHAEWNTYPFGGPLSQNSAGQGYYSVGPFGATFSSLEEAMQSSLVQNGDVLMVASGDYLGETSITKAVTIEIGSSPGIIVVAGSMLVSPGATINFELFGTDPSQYDQLLVAGALALFGEVKVSLGGGFTPTLGDSFKIADAYGILFTDNTTFYNLPALADGLSWQVSIVQGTTWNGADGEQLYLTVVPGPATVALLGVAGLLRHRRRR